MTDDLQRILDQKNRELQLVLALDKVRDALDEDGDPQKMFTAIARLLADTLQADACAITLLMETSDEVEFSAQIGMTAETALRLCREATHYPEPAALTVAEWQHVLAMRIILEDYPLGGVIAARSSAPFSDAEIGLLKLAESQIDSAAVQARMVWKLAQRNRELEAIYEIDRLRDHTLDEGDLIGGFTSVLLTHFDADLCMILLGESGDIVMRGVVNRNDIPPDELDEIRQSTLELRIPQVIATPVCVESLTLLAAPFIVGGERFGAVVIGRKADFTLGDHRLVYAMMSQMDSAVVHSRDMRRLTYFANAPDSTRNGIANAVAATVTVITTDLCNVEQWAEHAGPTATTRIANHYHERFFSVIARLGGTPIIGGSSMFSVVFEEGDHAYRAAYAALEMQSVHADAQAERAERGGELPALCIGISSGSVVIGRSVSGVSVIGEALKRSLNLSTAPGKILVAADTYALLGDAVSVDVLSDSNNSIVYQLLKLER